MMSRRQPSLRPTVRAALRWATAVLVFACAFGSAPAEAATGYRDRVASEPALVGYWRLGDIFGTTATAVKGPSGTYLNGAQQGQWSLLGSDADRSVAVDPAQNSSVSVSDSPALALSTMTIEAWVRPTGWLTTSSNTVVAKGSSYYLDLDQNGCWRFGVKSAGIWRNVRFSGCAKLGSTQHVVLTYDGASARLYLDGALSDTLPLAYTPDVTTASLGIGGYNGANTFKGQIDDVSLYTGALSATAAREHFELGADGNPPQAPRGVTAEAMDARVSLDWEPVAAADVAGYEVYRSQSATGPYTLLTPAPIASSRYEDTGLANETRQYYVVRAVDRAGNRSADSATVGATPTASTRYRASVLGTDGLQGYWRLGEGSGLSAVAERGPDGRYVGGPGLGAASRLAGDSNAAVDLDGVGDHVSLADADAFDATTSVTLEGWVRPDAAPGPHHRHILCKAATYCLAMGPTGLPNVGVQRAGIGYAGLDGPAPLAVGSTYHLAGVYDGSTLRLYVNGGLVAEQSLPGTVAQTASELQVGAYNGESTWNGIVDEAAIYDAPLSAAEIKRHFDIGAEGRAPAAPSGLVATAGDGLASLDWADNPETDLEGYDVYRSTTSGGAQTKLNTRRVTKSSYTDYSAANGQTYFYAVKAVNTAGKVSPASAEASARPRLASSYREAVVATGAARGYWRLGELSGTVASAERGSDGDYVAGPELGVASLLASDRDPAVKLSQTAGSHVRIPDSDALDLTTALSLEAWAKPGALASSDVLAKSGAYALGTTATGEWRFSIRSIGAWQSVTFAGAARADATQHAVVTYDGVTARLYLDGALVDSKALASVPDVTADPAFVGAGYAGNFTGTIDEAAVYGAVLSAAQVKQHFDLGIDGTPPAKPSAVTTTAGDRTVSVDWADNADADLAGYDVLRGAQAGGPYTRLNRTPVTVSAYADADVENDTNYFYVVRAVDQAGNRSASTAEVNSTPTTTPALLDPDTLHSNGAELRWTRYDPSADGTFDRYEVYRSASANFTPSATTLIATIRDAGQSTYRDTTAAPGKTFTYKLRTNGVSSGERTVTLPVDGQARMRLQPDGTRGRATYLRANTCANRGADPALRVGTAGPDPVRSLVAFDVRSIPTDATITSASLSLYAQASPAAAITVDAHRTDGAWDEGSGTGACTGDGATWIEAAGGSRWSAAGGAFEAVSTPPSVARASGSAPGWDTWDVKGILADWARGSTPNLGFLLKASDETPVDGKLATYYSDNTGQQPTLRPKLSVDYSEPSVHASAPTVAISSHQDGDEVTGRSVALAAGASDDGRVAKVEFLVDGAAVASDTTAPFQATWDSTTKADGAHTLAARATDDAGNIKTSSAASVTVRNSAPPTATVELPSAPYVDTVKADNPLAYWRLDETAGTTAADSSGNARPGTLRGAYTLAQPGLTGDGNQAVKFQPATATTGAGLMSTSALDGSVVDPGRMSAEAWVNTAAMAQADTYDHFIDRGWCYDGCWTTHDGRWVIDMTKTADGQHHMHFLVSQGGKQHSANARVDPGRHHVVGTYDGQAMRLYVDGVLASSRSLPGVTLNTNVELRVGGGNNDETIDDVAIYRQVLSPAQVQRHFDAAGRRAYPDTVKSDGPAGYWRLNETTGTAATDASGNARTATLSGDYLLAQPGLLGVNADRAVRFRDVPGNAAQDGKASVDGLGGLLGQKLTAEAWIDYAPAQAPGEYRRVLSRGWGASGGWMLAVYQSSSGSGEQLARFQINQGGVITYARVPMTPGRNHFAAIYDGAAMQVYVNGAGSGRVGLAGATLDTASPLLIGDALDAGEITIDEAAVYGSALSADSIRTHFAAGRGPALEGTETIKAEATDDRAVDRVDFYLDGDRFAQDTTAPFSAPLETKGSDPAYDGSHVLTTKAIDSDGQVTASNVANVGVANSDPDQQADITSSPVAPEMTYDPAAGATQEPQGIDVGITNVGAAPLKAASTAVRYRWIAPGGATVETGDKALAADVAPAATGTTRVSVPPPALTEGADRARYRLQLDLLDTATGTAFSSKGNKPAETPVTVNRKVPVSLGLERFHHYVGEDVGGGMQHLVNVASGNSLLRWTPFSSPGRGLSTVVNLTHNGLEDRSSSPVGGNWSLAISGLTRLGAQLDIHPNKADEIAGRTRRYVEFTDGDGSSHRFEGKQAADGSVYWEEPAGVHLYLRVFSTSDSTRKWALSRPDRTTFFFDKDGYPTSVQDKNGNRITYTLQATPPGEDPGGPKKRITAVTDAGGRKYAIDYYSKADAKKAQVRGKVKRISDHTATKTGSSVGVLDFTYFDDGNLQRLIQRGGTRANTVASGDGRDDVTVPDRSWSFTYTTPSGDGPATNTSAQSSRINSVRDPLGRETTFTYVGPGGGTDRWKLTSRTDREGAKTSFTYDDASRVTTVTAPLSRVSKYGYDAQGQVTKVTNPRNQVTDVEWTADRHVGKVTEPQVSGRTERSFTQYTYDHNGYVTETSAQPDEPSKPREVTRLTYEYLAADANDVTGKWRAGRDHEHYGQLKTKTDPEGTKTSSPADDFQWSFGYDSKGNLTSATDPETDTPTIVAYNSNGTVSRTTDPNGNATLYPGYDLNGLPTIITRPTGSENLTTAFVYDDDGLLRSIQDPEHAGQTAGNGREIRTFFDYDAFDRLTRQSTPKLKGAAHLIWSGVEFDANDNVVAEYQPAYGASFVAGPKTTTSFDAMDRPRLVTGPDKDADPKGERTSLEYDTAGRLTRTTSPRGVKLREQTGADPDRLATDYAYDELDRVIRETRYDFDRPSGKKALWTHYCYDTANDLVAVVEPKADVAPAALDCASLPGAFTERAEYYDSHRPKAWVDAIGQRTSATYDANGQVKTTTDERKAVTSVDYDQRGLPVAETRSLIQDAAGATTRTITSRREYDKAGNLARDISPRGVDASADGKYTEFATRYVYDRADRLIHVELPTSAASPDKRYVHRVYDRNGNLLSTSQPVTDPERAPDAKTSRMTYYDTGAIRTSEEGTDPAVTYDYTDEGWQSSRVPGLPGGGQDLGRQTTWEFNADGELKTKHDRGQGVTTYAYDPDGNLEQSVHSGINGAGKPKTVKATWDSLNRAQKVSEQAPGDGDKWRYTLDGPYDLNGNLEQRIEDAQEGSAPDPGRKHTFTYDGLDRPKVELDFGKDNTAQTDDDRRVTTVSYNEASQPLKRVLEKFSGGYQPYQTETWEYLANGQTREQKTLKSAPGVPDEILESHTLEYLYTEGGRSIYANGNRVKDTFVRKSPDSAVPCQASACTSAYVYDPRDALIEVAETRDGATDTTTLELDESGNVKAEKLNGTLVKSYAYDGNRLKTMTPAGGAAQSFVYDTNGDLDCVTTRPWSDNPRQDCQVADGGRVPDDLLQKVSHDGLNRMDGYRSYRGGKPVTRTEYAIDPLDRVTAQTETRGLDTASPSTRHTDFSFLGLSGSVTREEHRAGSASGSLTKTKTYSYDADGDRIGMTDQPTGGTAQDFSYGHDTHGNVTQLINQTTSPGTAKASYGYKPYGDGDAQLSRGDTSQSDPLSPYRYEAKRLDSASNTLDMGARRFSPDTSRFVQQDFYEDALGDLGLATDPLTNNRYALAGANPINYIETDGHEPAEGSYKNAPTAKYGRRSMSRRARRADTSRRTAMASASQTTTPDASDRNYASTEQRVERQAATSSSARQSRNRVQARRQAARKDDGVSASDVGHGALDVAGLVPVIGEPADAANGAWYAAEGDEANAALSFAAAVPGAGYAASAAKAGKRAHDATKAPGDLPRLGGGARGAGGRASKLGPDPKAGGAHTRFARGADGRVSKYTTFDEFGNEFVRFRGTGRSHGPFDPPLVLERARGKGPGARPSRAREPTPDELPRGY